MRHSDLLSHDLSTRLEALRALAGSDEPPSADVLGALVQCLGEDHKLVQRLASDRLARFAGRDPEVQKALEASLSHESPRLRWGAAYTLARIETQRPLGLSVLTENLAREDSDLRWAAAEAVVLLGRQHPDGVRPP